MLAGVILLPAAKWFVPGSRLQEAGIDVSPSVEKTLYLIAFACFLQGALCYFLGLLLVLYFSKA
jgi:hypothetical protein